MKITSLVLLALLSLLCATARPQTQINPATQINWPAVTGTAAPVSGCPITTASTTVDGSVQVTVADPVGLEPAQTVTGSGVASGTTVLAVFGNDVTLSAPATASGSGVALSFYPYGMPYTDVAHGVSYVCASAGWVTAAAGGLPSGTGVVAVNNGVGTLASSSAVQSAIGPGVYNAYLGYVPAHSGPNSDITSLAGLTTPLTTAQGGTGGDGTGYAYGNGTSPYTYSTTIPFASISGSLPAAKLPAFTGDASSTAGTSTLTLATVNTGPGICGDATHVCQITTNGKGLTTSQTAIALATGTVTNVAVSTANGFQGTVLNPTTTPAISLAVDATHYLPLLTDEANWNGKQPAGSYITGLTGDCAASGPGSVGITCTKSNGAAFGTAAFSAATAFDTSGAAATAQSNAETYASNASNLSSGTVGLLRLPTGIPNANLQYSATTVNGQTCALGGTCTITSSAGTITVGVTTIASGTNGSIEYNNAGTLGELGTYGTGSVLLGSGAVGSAAYQATSYFDLSGAAATAQSNAEAYAANGSNITSGTVAAARLPAALSSSTSMNGTSIPASDTLVDLAAVQTLTNKTLDGVTPTTMGYVDPISSIQTQLNGKQASLGYTPTNAAVVPSTAPTAGQLLVGNSGGTAYAPVSLSGDCTVTSDGAITCTKSGGTAFGTGAFATIANYLTIASAASTYEPALGNPSVNGYVLSSTTAGVRSWIAPGGGGSLPTAAQGQILTNTSGSTTYAGQSNIFYQQSGDTIASIEAACSSACTYVVTSPQTITLAASHAMSSNVWLRFEAQGKWNVTGAFTLSNVQVAPGTTATPHFSLASSAVVTLSIKNNLVPVLWFGAACDGSTNDLTAIQNTITATTYGQILLPPARCNVAGTLTITKSNVGIKGIRAGRGGYDGTNYLSNIVETVAGDDAIDIHGTSGAYLNFNYFEDFTVSSSVTQTGTSAGMSFSFTGGNTIKDVQARDFFYPFYIHASPSYGGGGFFHDQADWTTLSSAMSNPVGFYLDSSDGNAENSLIIRDSSTSKGTGNSSCIGMLLYGTAINDVNTYNFNEAGCQDGQDVNYTGTGATASASDIHFISTTVDQFTRYGMYFTASSLANAQSAGSSITVVDPRISTTAGSATYGIYTLNTSGVIISSGQFLNYGVYASGSSQISVIGSTLKNVIPNPIEGNALNYSTITANTITNASSSTGDRGIYLAGASANNTVNANSITGYFNYYGIYTDTSTTSNNTVIGNQIDPTHITTGSFGVNGSNNIIFNSGTNTFNSTIDTTGFASLNTSYAYRAIGSNNFTAWNLNSVTSAYGLGFNVPGSAPTLNPTYAWYNGSTWGEAWHIDHTTGGLVVANAVTAPSFTASGTANGYLDLGAAGASPGAPASGVLRLTVPNSVTAYSLQLPGAQPSGGSSLPSCTAANPSVCSWVTAPAGAIVGTTDTQTLTNKTIASSEVTTLPLSCQPGIGDGLNAIPAGTYLQTTCRNETGRTWTITAIRCVADAGSSTCNVTNGAGTGLLTGAITGTSTYANGTQSATTTIAAGDYLKITFVADGTSKQIGIDVAGTY